MTASHDHNPHEHIAALAADTLVQDRYRIVRQLGRGGMGAVYEAVDQRLGKTVALKETLSSEPSMRKQFEREARLLAGMQHPALPQVSDHFVEGHRAFLVMQFIGGVDLAKIIAQQPGPFPRDQVIAWADQLLDALIYLHSRDRQVIHRDIKPHNLKLTATGQIALLDFGLAKAQASDPSITASQSFFGYTRHYAPLEQIQDQRTDPRSDIYALGATLYHLLTGIKPPDAMVRATSVLNAGADPLKRADQIHAAVGPQIAAILNKAMAQKPEERYRDAHEFREALRRMGRAKDTEAQVVSSLGDNATIQPPVRKVHISELSPVRAVEAVTPKLALVGSARRFGPAGATAVLAVVAALAGGILYGSQRWFPAAEKLTPEALGPSETAAAMGQPGAARKADRSRAVDNLGVTTTKIRSVADTNSANRLPEKVNDASTTNSQAGKKPALIVRSMVNSGHRQEGPNVNARKNPQPVGVPSIRLPNPEFRDHAPTPSPDSRVRSYGSSSALPSSVAPKFFRAADGTQIVKFSDGSTQIVRPGQHTGSNATYR